ncbi:hypothetical protein MHB84_24205 [Paenibacillus sp. FSL F4-0087]|uniref:hypothetical protein n=1 Tax=Paenibacillus sp. FSL F4-0087 TaxID=2921368 RepID=UPI00096FC493|nr:hypothetical protein BK122_10745 [Paenibacillus pabuli]
MKSNSATSIKKTYWESIGLKIELDRYNLNVDVNNTELVYRQNIQSNLLSVAFLPNADHSMLKKNTAASKWRTNLIAIFFPRALFDDKYLIGVSQFV